MRRLTEERDVRGLGLELRQTILLVVSLRSHLGLQILVNSVQFLGNTLPGLLQPVHRDGLKATDHSNDIVEVLDFVQVLCDSNKFFHHRNAPPEVLASTNFGGHPQTDLQNQGTKGQCFSLFFFFRKAFYRLSCANLVESIDEPLQILSQAGSHGVGLLSPNVENKLVGRDGLEQVKGHQGQVMSNFLRMDSLKIDAVNANIFERSLWISCLSFCIFPLNTHEHCQQKEKVWEEMKEIRKRRKKN